MEWSLIKLDSLYDIGSSKRVLKSQWTKDGIPFYRGREITKLSKYGAVDNELYISELLYEELAEKYGVPATDDIVITAIGTLGNSYVVEDLDKFYFKDASVLWLKKKSNVSSEFINFWLKSPLFFSQLNEGNGATVDTLTIKKLKSVLVPLPSEDVQEKVVKKLKLALADIDQARTNTEQNLRNARELFDSYLQQVFSECGEGYEEKTLKEISLDFGRGKSKHRPRNDESLYGGQYPFIQTGDVRNSEHVIKSYSKTYNDKGLSQSKLWPKGTICITIAANIAETGILDFDACFPDSVIGIVVDPKLTSISYVEFLLQSFKAILKAKGKGSAQDNINLGTFEKMHFPFPSIEKQNEIVTSLNQLLEATIKLEAVYAKKINSLDELKQSLLQQAFTGQLTQG